MRKRKPSSTLLLAIGGACHPGGLIMMVILIHEHSVNMIYGVGVSLQLKAPERLHIYP